jgi:hypothetical protein
MTLRTTFDGQKIAVPKELMGHQPCEVEIVLTNNAPDPADRSRSSIWDVVAKSHGTLPPEAILHDTSAERDSWEHA